MHLPALRTGICRAHQVVMVPLVTADNGVARAAACPIPMRPLAASSACPARAALFHQLPPIFHAVLRVLEKASVLLAFEQRHQLAQSVSAIADQSDFDGISQADALGIEFNLDAASPDPGFGMNSI